MSRRATVIIVCDGPCQTAQRQGLPGQTEADLRLKLRGVGWHVDDDGDWCPACAPGVLS